jgi:hypothetical protein
MQLRGTDIVVDKIRAKQNVISGSGATRTLNETESGSLVLFDRAAGIVFTLPAPVPGIYFDFLVTTTITSGAAEVITHASAAKMQGTVLSATEATTPAANPGPKFFSGDGAASVKISQNGSTTGGIKGSSFRLTCTGTTTNAWTASGLILASGTIATPFA